MEALLTIRARATEWLATTEEIYLRARESLDERCAAEDLSSSDPTIAPLMLRVGKLLALRRVLGRRISARVHR